jgi:hypothetical protein
MMLKDTGGNVAGIGAIKGFDALLSSGMLTFQRLPPSPGSKCQSSEPSGRLDLELSFKFSATVLKQA